MFSTGRRASLAIDLGRTSVRAVRVRHGRSMQVVGTFMEQFPSAIDRSDAQGVGEWLGGALRSAGLGGGPAGFALERDVASLKILELPTDDLDELPGMVRMAMERDLPIEASEAVIDYTVVDHGRESTTVQAVAVPRREINRINAVADAAGLDVASITLRCLGTVDLVVRDASVGAMKNGLLVVDVTGEGLEIVLLDQGRICYSRGVGMEGPGGGPPTGEQLVMETRRSWLSYRVSHGDLEKPLGFMMGGSLAASIVEDAAEKTNLSFRAFNGEVIVDDDTNMTGVWPLIGLLGLERNKGHLNLANPRKEPDLSARLRQRALMVAGLAIVVGGIGWTIGNRSLADETARVADLRSKADSALKENLRFMRDELRAKHLDSWREIRPDWLEHLMVVATPRMGEGTVVLDQFGGSLLAEPTEYTASKTWVTEASTRLSVEGEADTQRVGFMVREGLVRDPRYTLLTSGADARGGSRLSFPFRFSMQSDSLDPGPEEPGAAVEDDS